MRILFVLCVVTLLSGFASAQGLAFEITGAPECQDEQGEFKFSTSWLNSQPNINAAEAILNSNCAKQILIDSLNQFEVCSKLLSIQRPLNSITVIGDLFNWRPLLVTPIWRLHVFTGLPTLETVEYRYTVSGEAEFDYFYAKLGHEIELSGVAVKIGDLQIIVEPSYVSPETTETIMTQILFLSDVRNLVNASTGSWTASMGDFPFSC